LHAAVTSTDASNRPRWTLSLEKRRIVDKSREQERAGIRAGSMETVDSSV
jgi:hypothetical protein